MLRPTAHFVLHLLAATVGMIAILVAATAWRLAQGPVPLTFLTPYIVDALRQSDAPFRFDVADTILVWAGWERTFDIVLLDVRVSDEKGSGAVIPEVSVRLSLPAMLRGMVAPTRLEIISARLRIQRAADGTIAIGLGEGEGEVANARAFLFADLLAPPDPDDPMGYLRDISIRDADLLVDDRRLGISWQAPAATLNFHRDAQGITGDGEFVLRIGKDRAAIRASGAYRAADKSTVLRLAFADLRPEWLAEDVAALAPLRSMRLPVSGSVALTLDEGGLFRAADFNLMAAQGDLVLDQWYDHPIPIVSARLRGRYDAPSGRLRIDEATLDAGGPKLRFDAVIAGFDDRLSIAGSAEIDDLPLDELGKYWPVALSTDTREWVTGNLTGGMIRRVDATINIRPGDLESPGLPDEAIATRIEVEDADVHFLRPLPPIEDVDATVIINGAIIEIETRGGRLDNLRVGDGRILIAGDEKGDFKIEIALPVSGPVSDAIALLDKPTLDYAKTVGIDPEAIAGTARARLRFYFPLLAHLAPEDIGVEVEATLSDLALSGVVEGYDLSQGALTVKLDNRRIEAEGRVALNGVPANVSWRQDFATGERRYRIEGRFTDSQRRGLGIPGDAYVTGPTKISAEIVATADGAQRVTATVDLREAAVRLPEIFWRKAPGVEGTFAFDLRRGAKGEARLDSFRLAADGLVAEGRAELAAGGGALRRLDVDRFENGETRVSAGAEVAADGAVKVAVVGESLDLRPFLDDMTGRDEKSLDTPLSLSLNVRRAIFHNGVVATDVSAKLRRRDRKWVAMKGSAKLAGGKRLVLGIVNTADGRVLRIGSDDAGTVLRALDVYGNAVGGKLSLTARLDSGTPGLVTGEMRIADFRAVKAPLLAKLLSVASLTGVIDLLKGEAGLPFTRLIIPFEKQDDLLTITDMRIYGPAIGLTGKGTIDLARDRIDIAGTLVPAYTLNSVFGKLPILGNILVGAKGGGLIAMSYRVTGPLADPKTTVNPLSALAPGFLQKIFSFTGKDSRDVEPFAGKIPDSSR